MDEWDEFSDEEVNDKQHSRLLNNVKLLDQRQIVKKSKRSEPRTHVSEYDAVTFNKNDLSIKKLVAPVATKTKRTIEKKIKSSEKVHTLPKPLEKPQAERIRRDIGFKKAQSELNKWNSIVDKNRVAGQLVFPLKHNDVYFIDELKEKQKPEKEYKSALDLELEKLEPKVETIHVENNKFPLSYQEIVQRRQEMARLRAQQSYQEAKARRQSKIKSKKYHRIEKKEKLRQHIKEFEQLKNTDPEEALRRLEQLEKTRVEERMSLRHRSTGHWAKNKVIRAKYDKDSRQALAQQLALSRELTQKHQAESDSSDAEVEMDVSKNDRNVLNPWTTVTSKEVDEFYNLYRKFWTDKNKQNEAGTDQQNEVKPLIEDISSEEDNTEKDEEETTAPKMKAEKIIPEELKGKQNKNASPNNEVITKKKKKSIIEIIDIESSEEDEAPISLKKRISKNQVNKSTEKAKKKRLEKQEDIVDMFEQLEDTARSKINKKLKNLHEIVKPSKKQKHQKTFKEFDRKSDINFGREKEMRADIDEELKNYDLNDEETLNEMNLKNFSKEVKKPIANSNVNPNEFMAKKFKPKVIELDTELPDISYGDDNSGNSGSDSENDDQSHLVSEAFADDSIVADFQKEKKDAIDANKPKDIDLLLPGWGTWGGKDLKPSKRKRKRFIIKVPKEMPRKDQNNSELFINENKNKLIGTHQVSEVPFPFTSVKDFEASIRNPVGDTFVPQTAFRRLIKPSVVTKKGAIIEPMSESVLLKQKFTQNGFLV